MTKEIRIHHLGDCASQKHKDAYIAYCVRILFCWTARNNFACRDKSLGKMNL